MAPGPATRFAREHAGTRTVQAQLPDGPDVGLPETTKEEAVAIPSADPGEWTGWTQTTPAKTPATPVMVAAATARSRSLLLGLP